jgi:hypothetical protein
LLFLQLSFSFPALLNIPILFSILQFSTH